jgi:phosphoglycolate phosphatase
MCVQLCEELSLTHAVVPGANHSLETGDVALDIKNIGRVMETVEKLFL